MGEGEGECRGTRKRPETANDRRRRNRKKRQNAGRTQPTQRDGARLPSKRFRGERQKPVGRDYREAFSHRKSHRPIENLKNDVIFFATVLSLKLCSSVTVLF